jgi:ATP-binding cassette subfamily B protein
LSGLPGDRGFPTNEGGIGVNQDKAAGSELPDILCGVRKLLVYMKPYRMKMLIVISLAAGSALFSILGPKILAVATDELAAGISRMTQGEPHGIDLQAIGFIAMILLGLYLISTLIGYLEGHMMAEIATRTSYRLRNELISKINRMPLGFFHRNRQGDILSRITNDVDLLEQSLSQSMTQVFTSVTMMVGVFVMMLSINWQLTLISVVMVVISLWLVSALVKVSQKYFHQQQLNLGRVSGQVEESYGGHVVLKAFNGEKRALRRFDEANESLGAAMRNAEFYSGLMMPVIMFVSNLAFVVVCIVGAAMATNGRISIGGIQAFIQYVRSFTQPIIQLSNLSSQLQRMAAASDRVFGLLEEPEEVGSEQESTLDPDMVHGMIRFEDVRFGYEPDQPVIRRFNLEVQPGRRVAIVGPTGAGKTTIIKLLMRFYDPSSGSIRLDGQDLGKLNRRAVRRIFGMVLQDTWLFHGSIMDNILYGRLSATDEEVMEAARKAQVDAFIRSLPKGYHMMINEESDNISHGQKQLITIARTILADPRVLILDEATSSVDTRTEGLIQQALEQLMQGRTSFIIAHRLSTIQNADLILCLKDGDIVEQGTHHELLQKGGFYASLYRSQFHTESAVGS